MFYKTHFLFICIVNNIYYAVFDFEAPVFAEKSTLKQRFNYMVQEFRWQHQEEESHLCFNEMF